MAKPKPSASPSLSETIQGLGKVAVVVVKEKRKKPVYLVCTNIHLPAIDVIKYYAKRWKIEQMIKDLKQRLGWEIIKSEI